MIGKKNVKARKEYKCESCGDKINKGELYTLYSYRTPRYAECINDPTEDGPQIGIDYWKVRTHLEETNCHLPESCRNGIHTFFTYDIGYERVELCEDCGCTRKDAIKPPVIFTDWDAECDLLKDWLKYTIFYEPLDNISIRPDPLLSQQEILKMFQEQGIMYFDSVSYVAHEPLNFEAWKQTLNQTQYV